MGDATKATAEKGIKMWDLMILHMIRFVESIKNAPLKDLYQKRY
jgi:creatinine amidohydrolase